MNRMNGIELIDRSFFNTRTEPERTDRRKKVTIRQIDVFTNEGPRAPKNAAGILREMGYKMHGRRNFIRLLGVGGLSGALMASGQESHSDTRNKEFKGTSKKGDLLEALQEAIAAAQRSVRHPDALVEWKFKGISGRNGGFAGFHEITVVIDALVH